MIAARGAGREPDQLPWRGKTAHCHDERIDESFDPPPTGESISSLTSITGAPSKTLMCPGSFDPKVARTSRDLMMVRMEAMSVSARGVLIWPVSRRFNFFIGMSGSERFFHADSRAVLKCLRQLLRAFGLAVVECERDLISDCPWLRPA